ncbi:MAG TPA: HEPN domain-containing protein [Chloroflexota bacterium]|nr:HEPN domain-containing protein [Chloroflexota bacterium]
MQPEDIFEAQTWLAIARRDLQTAEYLLEGGSSYTGSAAFHCQQTVEKAPKAYPAYHGQALPRTPDLERLRSLCEALEPAFGRPTADYLLLTDYAVDVRYPGDTSPPPLPETLQLVEIARQADHFVASRIPTA